MGSTDSDDFEDLVNNRRMSVTAQKYNPHQKIDPSLNPIVPKTDDERKKIEKMLRTIYIFKEINQTQLTEVVNYISTRSIKNGETIMTEDDPADNFYIIQEGNFEAFKTTKNGEKAPLFTYKNEGYFGELALIHNTPRCATIKSLSNGLLWVLDGKIFRNVVQKHAFNQRKKYESLLKTANILNTLNDYDRSRLSDALSTKEFKKGEIILEEGKMVTELYIVAEGGVQIMKTVAGKPVLKMTLKESDLFGYEGIIANKPATFTAVAATNCKMVILSENAYKAFLSSLTGALKAGGEEFLKQIK